MSTKNPRSNVLPSLTPTGTADRKPKTKKPKEDPTMQAVLIAPSETPSETEIPADPTLTQEDPPMQEGSEGIEDLSDLMEDPQEDPTDPPIVADPPSAPASQEKTQEDPAKQEKPSWDGLFLAVHAGRCVPESGQKGTFSVLIKTSQVDLDKVPEEVRKTLVYLGSEKIADQTLFFYTTRLAQSAPSHLAKKLGSILPKSYTAKLKGKQLKKPR